MGREEEGLGERMDLYPLIKEANVKLLPTCLKTHIFPKGRADDAVGFTHARIDENPAIRGRDLCFDKTCQ